MKGKRTEIADWIMAYLEEQGEDTSDWKSYHTLYLRYAGRIKKYHPENYEQFLTTCTFAKQTKKECGAKDLGSPKQKEPYFNEERYWKDQRKDWEVYKTRMEHYRDEKIRNQEKVNEEKDLMPYEFKFALKCLGGTYPIEAFPEELEEYREELQNMLNDQKLEKVWI